jgi:hypothetical protein
MSQELTRVRDQCNKYIVNAQSTRPMKTLCSSRAATLQLMLLLDTSPKNTSGRELTARDVKRVFQGRVASVTFEMLFSAQE